MRAHLLGEGMESRRLRGFTTSFHEFSVVRKSGHIVLLSDLRVPSRQEVILIVSVSLCPSGVPGTQQMFSVY